MHVPIESRRDVSPRPGGGVHHLRASSLPSGTDVNVVADGDRSDAYDAVYLRGRERGCCQTVSCPRPGRAIALRGLCPAGRQEHPSAYFGGWCFPSRQKKGVAPYTSDPASLVRSSGGFPEGFSCRVSKTRLRGLLRRGRNRPRTRSRGVKHELHHDL